jgi:hypothetical protein
MRKIIAILLLALAPMCAFADFQVGGAVLYAGTPFGLATSSGSSSIVPFGVEARWKFLYVFQIGLSGLILPGSSPSATFLTDVGVVVDLPPFTLGCGLGPDFSIGLGGDGSPATTLVNFKAFGEINFGIVAIGLVAFDPVSALSELRRNWPWIGVTAIVTLF